MSAAKAPKLASTKAAKQAQAADPAKQKALFRYYNRKIAPTHIDQQRFRLMALLRKDQTILQLNNYMQALQWQEQHDQAWMQGSITLTAMDQRKYLKIGHGDLIRNEVWWGGRWLKLWDMRVWDPDRVLQPGNPQLQATLYDDLHLLSLSKDDFHYSNMFCHEIAIKIGQRYKIPMGRISMGTHKIKTFDQKDASPLDAILAAYKQERDHTGRKFVLRWSNGKLEIQPMRRNPFLYVMHRQLLDATIHHTTPDDFATALTGRTTQTQGKNKKTQKRSLTLTQGVSEFGYVHQFVDYTKSYNDTQLHQHVATDLAKRQKITHAIEFDHQGISVIRKGDAVNIYIPEEGYKSWHSLVWVSDITHQLAPGQYTMTPTVSASPPSAMPDVTVAGKGGTAGAGKSTARTQAANNQQQRQTKRTQRTTHSASGAAAVQTLRNVLRGEPVPA